jgi:tRNA pseudouridine32 synthase/23S rRNA pseudouridine746 synthase
MRFMVYAACFQFSCFFGIKVARIYSFPFIAHFIGRQQQQLHICSTSPFTSHMQQPSTNRIVSFYAQQFYMRRNVTIVSPAWLTGNLPLQIYRATGSVRPRRVPTWIDSNNSSCFVTKNISNTLDATRMETNKLETNNLQAEETRAPCTLNASEHLHILYLDEYICVAVKPSGVLSVPGARRNPSLAGLVHDVLCLNNDDFAIDIDRMIVHRLDMDTSGLIVYALTLDALKQLHHDFRNGRVKKTYHALLFGHVQSYEISVDVALERDPSRPSFMRIAQPRTDSDTTTALFQKYMMQTAAKPSRTDVRVMSYEYLLNGTIPVTRVELVPHTGRTHQLRVHTASINHGIVGDKMYGDPRMLERSRNGDLLNIPLCLHAGQLCFNHPISGAPMIFQCDSAF